MSEAPSSGQVTHNCEACGHVREVHVWPPAFVWHDEVSELAPCVECTVEGCTCTGPQKFNEATYGELGI